VRRLLDRRSPRLGWFLLAGFALLVVCPAVLSDFRLGLLAKYLCFAIVAVGIDLAWGYGGMLTLGQGLFFGMGGYAMGMFLKLQEAGPGGLPDFMVYNGLTEVPAFWKPFAQPWFALPAAILLPMAVAAGLGVLVFRQRVRGAYFAILTQALAAAFVILLIGQQGFTAGTNGLTNMRTLFGYDLNDPVNQRSLYFVVAVVLGGVFLLARQLVASRFGRLLVAVRDGEERVRFLGYNPAVIKTIGFATSAGIAGIAGAMAAPIIGIVAPNQFGIVPSILVVCWVAVGGRGTLWGAVLGALAVNWLRDTVSSARPDDWQYVQGGLFIVVLAFAPGGLVGIVRSVRTRIVAWRSTSPSAPAGVES
jgi:urea transport system permease protein